MSRFPTTLWWVFGALLLFGGSLTVAGLTRGLRNNNPGNIRRSSTVWNGERPTVSDTSFEEFVTMPYGIRAATILFRNYQRLYGLNTINKLISRWAPPNENDTPAYIAFVANRVGLDADTPLDLNGPVIYPFLRAVFVKENGALANTMISESDLRQGVALAS